LVHPARACWWTLLHEMQKRDAKKGLATLCISAAAWELRCALHRN